MVDFAVGDDESAEAPPSIDDATSVGIRSGAENCLFLVDIW